MVGKQTLPEGNERQGRSPLEECFATLGETHQESVYRAIERLVEAGEQVGFNCPRPHSDAERGNERRIPARRDRGEDGGYVSSR